MVRICVDLMRRPKCTWRDAVDTNAHRQEFVRKCRRCMANRRFGVHVRETESRSSRVLCPAVHTARHHHLRDKFPSARDGTAQFLPFLQQREERERHPIGTDRVCAYDVVEVFFLEVIEVCRLECGGGSFCWPLELALLDAIRD